MTKEGYLSESDTCREIILPYLKDCKWILDIGFGGSAICPEALTFDLPKAYTRMGEDKQLLQGSARDLHFFCDNSVDAIYSSHLLEDFSYQDQLDIITEWKRVLKPNGLLAINCPDQQKYVATCQKTGQPYNSAHLEQDFSLTNFKERVLHLTGNWQEIFIEPNHGPYSWLGIWKRV